MSNFVFCTCQVGAEPALKKEIALSRPDLKFAYSRPGFVTFKSATPITPDFKLESVFARTYGENLGKTSGETDALLELIRKGAQDAESPLKLHVWERDHHPPGDEPKDYWEESRARVSRLRNDLMKAGNFGAQTEAKSGELIFDVIIVEENEVWVGRHTHSDAHLAFPGGRLPISLPDEAPSRAFLKIEENIAWSGIAVEAGQTALEIGSAPGGASYALLKRGLKVVGIDPGKMDPIIDRNPNFKYIPKSVFHLWQQDLPVQVDWLLLDMNADPEISLKGVETVMGLLGRPPLGLFLTLKLNQWSYAERIPEYLERIKQMGMLKVRAKQLPSNKQEITIFALSRRGKLVL